MRKENSTKLTTSDVRSARTESAARRILHVPAKATKETGIPARVADENDIGGHATCVCVAAQRGGIPWDRTTRTSTNPRAQRDPVRVEAAAVAALEAPVDQAAASVVPAVEALAVDRAAADLAEAAEAAEAA